MSLRGARTGWIASAGVATVMALAGCAGSGEPDGTMAGNPAESAASSELLAEHDLDGLDARELIDTLDAQPLAERTGDLSSSITGSTLTLTDQHRHATEIALPEDEVYVSIAPYRTQTHECYNHSPTGCVGELRNTEVDVTVTDGSGGTIVDEPISTFDNGFVGLWLPRDIDATVTIAHAGETSTATLSTAGDEVQTCVTTMKLA